jgi:hypothetical protein
MTAKPAYDPARTCWAVCWVPTLSSTGRSTATRASILCCCPYQVGVTMWMVSTRNGEELMRATGSRYSVDLEPAFSPQDIAIHSVTTLLEFRDVTLARAEEEVSRELVLRIPVSEKLRSELAARALEHAAGAEF